MTITCSKQIFDETGFEEGNFSASHFLDLQYLCGSHMAQKAINQLQAPRRTALPWRDATSESLCPDPSMHDPERGPIVIPTCERHEDNCEEKAAVTREPEQPSEHSIVRQTTIVWQNILENSSPCKQRKMALEVARKTSKDMWFGYENKSNTVSKCTSKTRPNHHKRSTDTATSKTRLNLLKSFTNTTKQNDTFQIFETPSCTRSHKEIKLAKITPESLTSNALGLERSTNTNTSIQETSGGRNLFFDFETPSARHGNRTILPSIQKVT